jgi:hypothetical protein
MAKKKQYTEGQLISLFKLTRINDNLTPKMTEWLDVNVPELVAGEEYILDFALRQAKKNITAWNEEELKMKFISHILPIGYLIDNNHFMTYYEKSLSGKVDGIPLSVKTDFMVAKGVLSFHQNPYFHFHEYKPQSNPTGEPMAQLVEAFLLAQEKNQNGKPIYGAEIIGQYWKFVVMQGREYCISRTFDSVEKEELLQIIAILRKFRYILENELLE